VLARPSPSTCSSSRSSTSKGARREHHSGHEPPGWLECVAASGQRAAVFTAFKNRPMSYGLRSISIASGPTKGSAAARGGVVRQAGVESLRAAGRDKTGVAVGGLSAGPRGTTLCWCRPEPWRCSRLRVRSGRADRSLPCR